MVLKPQIIYSCFVTSLVVHVIIIEGEGGTQVRQSIHRGGSVYLTWGCLQTAEEKYVKEETFLVLLLRFSGSQHSILHSLPVGQSLPFVTKGRQHSCAQCCDGLRKNMKHMHLCDCSEICEVLLALESDSYCAVF